jgi:Transposase DNA-binding
MDGSCCAQEPGAPERPEPSLEALSWAMAQFAQCDLGDTRRDLRLVRLAAAIAEHTSMSLPKQFPAGADLAAAYRFFSNPHVDPQAILAPHLEQVRQQALAHPVVLCVADDTEVDLTRHAKTQGRGQIGDGRGLGLLQHSALAVLPEGQVLGLLEVAWHAPEPTPADETLRQRQARWNQSDVWPEAVEAIGPWPGPGMLVQVGDRHADQFRHLGTVVQQGHAFVVRAMHDRYVDEPSPMTRIWAKLQRQPVLGQIRVQVGAQRDHRGRVTRQGREAVLSLRTAPVVISPPCNDPRTETWPAIAAWAIYLQEENPPANLPPDQVVEWMLLSSLAAEDLESAIRLTGYYTRRWVIEEWHRCYKQGCRIEASQLDDVEDIQRLGAVLCVVAVRLLQVRDLADPAHPEANNPQALRELVPPTYLQVVARMCGQQPEELTPRQFFLQVARQGGYLGRKGDPRPGWIVLWRGWYDLLQMVRGIELYQSIMADKSKCVEG